MLSYFKGHVSLKYGRTLPKEVVAIFEYIVRNGPPTRLLKERSTSPLRPRLETQKDKDDEEVATRKKKPAPLPPFLSSCPS